MDPGGSMDHEPQYGFWMQHGSVTSINIASGSSTDHRRQHGLLQYTHPDHREQHDPQWHHEPWALTRTVVEAVQMT